MWTFEIQTGRIFDPTGTLAGTGYAGGNLGKVPEAVNNPDYVKVHNTGPLPPGDYDMVELVAQSHLGPNAIRLEPRPENEMFGRAGFYIHPDLIDAAQHPQSASEGCIVYTQRMQMWNSSDHGLHVVPFSELLTPMDITGS
jgi:hypothetical protein